MLDLHMHLNGSYSIDFLRKIAERNKCMPIFEEFLGVCNDKHTVALIWKRFALIHQLVQTLEDIREGTVDVIKTSKASYLEIRTTAKPFENKTLSDYIAAFIDGLIQGNQQFQGKKIARGLLSLDRTHCTEEDAYFMIDKVVAEKEKSGMLVGIDLCGNPFAPRTLTGETLARVLRYALEKPIGIALHIGEADTPIEQEETNTILNLLESFPQPLQGKVRLGHAIFLSETQLQRIHALQAPIEICPTCHEKVNWCTDLKNHPVKQIYSLWKQPVVPGTDDAIIFDCDAEKEYDLFCKIVDYTEGNRESLYQHHAKFRF